MASVSRVERTRRPSDAGPRRRRGLRRVGRAQARRGRRRSAQVAEGRGLASFVLKGEERQPPLDVETPAPSVFTPRISRRQGHRVCKGSSVRYLCPASATYVTSGGQIWDFETLGSSER